MLSLTLILTNIHKKIIKQVKHLHISVSKHAAVHNCACVWIQPAASEHCSVIGYRAAKAVHKSYYFSGICHILKFNLY